MLAGPDSPVQALIDALSLHPALTLGAVFAAALLESVAVIGMFVPGSLVVFVAVCSSACRSSIRGGPRWRP